MPGRKKNRSVPTAENVQAPSLTSETESGIAPIDNSIIPKEKNDNIKKQMKGFSDDDFDKLVQKYGALPKGENPVREIDVPKKTSDSNKVRKFVQTVLESKAITDDMVQPIKEKIVNGDLSYKPISDQTSINHAKTIIRTKGLEGSRAKWKAVIEGNTPASKDDIALGEMLLEIAAENKDTPQVLEMIGELAAEGTRAGQTVQAMRMMKKMQAFGELEYVGDLYYIKKTVDHMNTRLEKQFKNRKNIPQIKIDEELANKFANAKSDLEKEAAIGEIYQNLADQLPDSWLDKWNAWRYMSMLGNPRTHIRNIVGNAVFMPAVKMKNIIGAGLEKAFIKDGVRTKSLTVSKPYKDYAAADYTEVKELITSDGKYNPTDMITSRKRIFNNKWLERARKANFALLEKEDMFFIKIHYQRSLAEYLQANKIDLTNITDLQLDRARMYAVKEAQKATYRDASAVARILSSASKNNISLNLAIEGLTPFKKTPINILKRGVEYSPAGLIHTIGKSVQELNAERFSSNEFIDGLSANLTGTTIMVLGAYLAFAGILKGAFKNDDGQLKKMEGMQEYSVQIGNKNYTIDWAAPLSLPLFVGAEIYAALDGKWENASFSDYVSTMAKITEPMFNLSMLDGLNSTIEAVSFSDDKLTALGAEILSSYLQQAVPTLIGQFARTIDNKQRRTYPDVNKEIPKGVQYFIQRVMNKIPLLSYLNQPRVDQWGKEQTNGNYLLEAFENFLSPGYVGELNEDKVTSEVSAVYEESGEREVIPNYVPKYFSVEGERIDLSAEDYTEYQKIVGTTAYNLLDSMIDTSEYQNSFISDQVDIISTVYEYSRAVGKVEVSDYKLDGWQEKAYNAYNDEKIPVEQFIYLKTKLKPYGGFNAKKEYQVEAINALNITRTQKDYIYLLSFTDKKIDDTPWH